MAMRRIVMAAGGAILPIAAISLAFGNPWVAEAVREQAGPGYEGVWHPVYWLQNVRWFLYPDNGTSWSVVVAVDSGALLSLALLAALAALGVRAADPDRGALSAVVTGWWACFVAAGVGGLITGVLVESVIDGAEFHKIGGYLADGASFGLLYGWTAGLGMLAGLRLARDGGRPSTPRPEHSTELSGPG
ncbi:hypothetical protein [Actinomadura rifamycini]|uniref:hypothetical protein n=1 Tax=Actinomadura rifamycini TaxID=31962 RepID=UPI0012F82D0D|nr:hypothetical protein [Actinomadura rifamycini]